MTFFVVIGTLLLLAGAALFIGSFFVRSEEQEGRDEYGRRAMLPPHPIVIQKWVSKKMATLLILISLPLMLFSQLFFMAEEGHNYYVRYPFGGSTVHTEARGFQWAGFGRVTAWKDYLTVSTDVDEGSGKFLPVPVRFSDKVTGTQKVTVRFKTPDNAEQFVSLVKEFRTQENLVAATLIPTVQEVVSNTPYMFTGQGYASGEAADYKYAVRDQLVNGSYVLVEVSPQELRARKIVSDSSRVIGGADNGDVILMRKPKMDSKTGKPQRILHAISVSGITVTQVTLPDIDFNGNFDKKLEEQRTQSAKIQEFALKTKAKEQEIKFENAQGELDKTKERITQEKDQIKALIAIETGLKRDSIALQQSRVLEEKAKVEARTLKVQKDAESEANRKMVAAGLTPQERAEWEYKTKVGIARELKEMNVPSIMGSSSGNGSATEQLLQLKVLESLEKLK